MTNEEYQHLEQELKYVIHDLHYLMHIIANSHKMVTSLTDSDLQRYYAKQTLPTIADFEKVLLVLRPLLDKKFDYERENQIPIDIKYRKLYQNLFKS